METQTLKTYLKIGDNMSLKHKIFTLALALLFLAHAPAMAKEVELRICMVNTNTLYNFKDNDGWHGLDMDIFSQLNLDSHYVFVEADFAVALAMLEQDQCSMLLPSVIVTENLKKRFLTSSTHLPSNLRALTLKESPIEEKIDIEYSTVGVIKGSSAEDYALAELKNATIIALRNKEDLLELLLKGEIETIVGREPDLKKIQKENAALQLLPYILMTEEVAFIFPKKNQELRDIVSSKLTQLQHDGVIEKLYKTWTEEK